MTTIGEKIISTKPCTTCGAAIGEGCKDLSGTEISILHIARTETREKTPKRKK